MILYITREQAEITHLKTVELSGGGSTGVIIHYFGCSVFNYKWLFVLYLPIPARYGKY